MASTLIEQTIGDVVAGADLSASQNCFVKLSTAANRTVLLAGAGDYAIGVLTNKPKSGVAAAVQVMGEAKVQFGGTVTRGDPVTSDASGHAITQTGQNPIIGYAMVSGSSGEIHPVLLLARPLSTGVAGSTLAIPVALAGISGTATYATYVPGYAFTVKKVTYVPTVVSTTAAKAATLTAKISGTGMTGGVLALTSANTGTLGTNVAGSAVSALNTGAATDSIDLVASSVTAFVEGSGVVLIELQ